jgi:carbon storage regulator
MLVLSRKKGEKVVIGRQIELTVLEVRKDRVKLGFSAPPEVPIHRHELQCQIDGSQPGPLAAECP